MKSIIYPATVTALIIAFNAVMFMPITGDTKISLIICILLLLLAIVIFKNKTIKVKTNVSLYLSLGLTGIALTFIKLEVAFVYAGLGLILLTITQLKIAFQGKSSWFLVGGDPLHKLNTEELNLAGLGLTMILSVMLPFFIKVAWLTNAI